MEPIFAIVLFGAIALMKWLAGGKGIFAERGENQKSARPGTTDEEERMRKFMEALGIPKPTEPPPTVRNREEVRRRIIEQQRTPQPRKPVRPLPARTFPQPVVSQTQSDPVVVVAPPRPATFVEKIAPLAATDSTPQMDVRMALLRGASLRDAIILREVLGPPRSLQSYI